MPRYVILHHELPSVHPRASHWDFMLEADGALRTWALDEEPREGTTVAAVQLADHRIAYLTYEGAVPGDRGSVSRWDEGTYETQEESPGRIRVCLAGKRLSGVVELRLERAAGGAAQRWLVSFVKS